MKSQQYQNNTHDRKKVSAQYGGHMTFLQTVVVRTLTLAFDRRSQFHRVEVFNLDKTNDRKRRIFRV